jgi:hypothetical protein
MEIIVDQKTANLQWLAYFESFDYFFKYVDLFYWASTLNQEFSKGSDLKSL